MAAREYLQIAVDEDSAGSDVLIINFRRQATFSKTLVASLLNIQVFLVLNFHFRGLAGLEKVLTIRVTLACNGSSSVE